jgi:hypothetical protein
MARVGVTVRIEEETLAAADARIEVLKESKPGWLARKYSRSAYVEELMEKEARLKILGTLSEEVANG